MDKNTLPVNFQDDILNSAMGGKRRYKMINNSDGTISLEDATTYDQVGSNFGAAQMNATNQAVNAAADASKIIDDIDAIRALTQEGYMAGALALKQVDDSLGEDENGMTIHEKLDYLMNNNFGDKSELLNLNGTNMNSMSSHILFNNPETSFSDTEICFSFDTTIYSQLSIDIYGHTSQSGEKIATLSIRDSNNVDNLETISLKASGYHSKLYKTFIIDISKYSGIKYFYLKDSSDGWIPSIFEKSISLFY